MDFLVLILVLALATLIALPIIAIATANSRASQLRAEMAELIRRIHYLEERLENLVQRVAAMAEPRPRETVQAAPAAPAAVSPPPKVEALRTPEPVLPPASFSAPAPATFEPPAPIAPPRFSSLETATDSDSRSLESRIGSQWFNRIGILAVLIGVAWFLKLAFDNHWIGPLGRVLIGLVAGAVLTSADMRFFPIP